jgi:hypothetical protein
LVRERPGGGGTHANSVWRLAKPPGKANTSSSSSPAPASSYQLGWRLPTRGRRADAWACARRHVQVPRCRLARELSANSPSRHAIHGREIPALLVSRVFVRLAVGRLALGSWRIYSRTARSSIFTERMRLHFYLIVLQSFAAAPMCSAPHKKKIVVAYFDYTPERRSAR